MADRREFARHGLLNLIGSILGRGGVLVVAVAVAQRLGPSSLGLFTLATIIGALLYLASDGGLTSAILAYSQGDPEHAMRLQRVARYRRLAYSLIATLIGICVSRASPDGMSATLIILSYILQSWSKHLRLWWIVEGNVAREVRAASTERIVATIFAVLVLHSPFAELRVVGLVLFASSLAFLLYSALSLHSARAPLQPPQGADPDVRVPLVRLGKQVCAGSLLAQAYSRVDTLLLAVFASTTVVGGYAAVYNLVTAAMLIPAALHETGVAHILRATGGEVADRLHQVLSTVVGVAGGLLIAVLGPSLATLLFDVVAQPVGFICAALGCAFFFMSENSRLNLRGLQGKDFEQLLPILGGALAGNLLLCLLLVPGFGAAGAAVATLTTEFGIYIIVRVPGGYLTRTRQA